MTKKKQPDSYILAADTLAKDMLAAMLQEIKALPDVWQKMSEKRQGDVIDRLQRQVRNMVEQTVSIISSQGMIRLACDLSDIKIGKEIEAKLIVPRANPTDAIHEFYESRGQAVVLVLANPDQFTGGMDAVQADADQPNLDLDGEFETDTVGDDDDLPPDDVALIGHDGEAVEAEFTEEAESEGGETD